MAPFHTPPQYQTSSNIRLRDEDMDRYRPPVFLKKKEMLASQISASCFKHPGVSPVGAQDIYLPDSVSKGLSVSESLLKSSGSASCSSSMQSLSVRFPDREYFASAATTEIKSFVSNGDFSLKLNGQIWSGGHTSVVAGGNSVWITGLLQFMNAPVHGWVILSLVSIALFPLLEKTQLTFLQRTKNLVALRF